MARKALVRGVAVARRGAAGGEAARAAQRFVRRAWVAVHDRVWPWLASDNRYSPAGGSQLEKAAKDVYPSKAAESVITGPMDVVVAAALWNSVCICAWAAGAIAIASA